MNKFFTAVILLAAGCTHLPERKTTEAAEASFAQLTEEFLAGHLAWRPQMGTMLGLHEYDGKLTDFSRASIDAELARLRRFDHALARFNAAALSPQAFYEFLGWHGAVRNELFNFEDMESYIRNPMTYASAIDVNIYIKRNFAPLEERVKSIIRILQQTPRVVAAAKANLAGSLPRPYVETAVEISNGAADFLSKDLVAALKEVKGETLRLNFENANNLAIAELRDYASWLEKEKLPKSHTNYALGREKYRRMLRGELITDSPERLLEIGLNELRREQQIFAETAQRIDPSKKPIDVFREIQKIGRAHV